MMKKILSKIVTGAVTLSLLASLACHANITSGITSFSDVIPGTWEYETIMEMARLGIFKGTAEPVNGVGTFSPKNVMTKAEFITASMRAVFPTESASIATVGAEWWRGFYDLAIEKQIITRLEVSEKDVNQPANRAEMSMIMVRCLWAMGERAERYVSTGQISDINKIPIYYKRYVIECFSMGLLNGVDETGTFAPDNSLTRAEAATAICRLIDKDMRVEVQFPEESGSAVKPNDNGSQTQDGKTDKKDSVIVKPGREEKPDKEEDPVETEKPEEEDSDLMPWEKPDAKQPSEYTWEEYEELSDIQQQAFQYYMGSDAFYEWLNQAFFADVEIPWKNGEKQPSEYTLSEYEELSEILKIAFRNEFTEEEYEAWREEAERSAAEQVEMPWEEPGATPPDDYTHEEYLALTPAQQIAFQKCFDFASWLDRVQGGTTDTEEMPWEEPGATQPDDYTYEEYLALSPAQQIAFQKCFDFYAWLDRVKPQG